MRRSTAACTCGRQMPVIQEIEGRTEDTVIGPDGRKMVRFHGIFTGIQSIIEGQIVQLDYANFVVNIVASRSLSELERKSICHRMESQLGNIKVEIVETDCIPRGPNGKFNAVVSKLK
jgi:phenylacetate-CoA ligase